MYISEEKVINTLEKKGFVPNFKKHRNQLTLEVPKEKLIEVFEELKTNSDTNFDMCVDITCIDWLKTSPRFEIVYILYSNQFEHFLRVITLVDEKNPHCPSAVNVWASANWYERETYDMYGIIFDNHPFLRRFYMPEDYRDPSSKLPIYPLRKDIPLMGIPESLPLPPYPEKFGDLI